MADACHMGQRWKMTSQRVLPLIITLAAPFLVWAASNARVIQTNSAGDNVNVIDPVSNHVAGVIHGIEVPHGVAIAPDGSRLYITEESTSTLDVVDSKTLKVVKKIPLSGRPNNVAVTNDGREVYVGIAQAPGAVDVIDTIALTKVKSI